VTIAALRMQCLGARERRRRGIKRALHVEQSQSGEYPGADAARAFAAAEMEKIVERVT
jgi:hypothetical protein